MKNFVDERFEICALIFRFLPGHGYDETETEYQRMITDNFSKFANHPTVLYAKTLELGYDAVANFSVHIEKRDDEKFYLLNNLQSLTKCGRWNKEKYETFIKRLNDFYADTQFGEFFISQTAFYEEETQKFIDKKYSKINFEWFGERMDMSKMRCIFSPSLRGANYGASLHDGYIYSIVPHDALIVHEYCHYFANPIAEKWYSENDRFTKLCDDTAATNKIPWYETGLTFAYEYMTRAYNILYDFQHGEANLQKLFARERDSDVENGFPFIEQVYAMVLEADSLNKFHI